MISIIEILFDIKSNALSIFEIEIRIITKPITIAKNCDNTTIDSIAFIENRIVNADQMSRQKNRIDNLLEKNFFTGYSLNTKNINAIVFKKFKYNH